MLEPGNSDHEIEQVVWWGGTIVPFKCISHKLFSLYHQRAYHCIINLGNTVQYCLYMKYKIKHFVNSIIWWPKHII